MRMKLTSTALLWFGMISGIVECTLKHWYKGLPIKLSETLILSSYEKKLDTILFSFYCEFGATN